MACPDVAAELRRWADEMNGKMTGQVCPRFVAAACLMLVALPAHTQNRLRVPVTIEVLRDVPAHKDDQPSQKRGVLYVSTPKPFTIRKGQRFLMIKV